MNAARRRCTAGAAPLAQRLHWLSRHQERKEGAAMNWDRIEGQWRQLKGQALQRWAKLTDDDWDLIRGKREELVGKLQEIYGARREQAERDVDDWTRGLN
jgi:uncharacterized protein YjbJ (UPF0337 family)